MATQRPKSFSKYGQHLEMNIHPVPIKPSSAKPIEVVHRPRVNIKPTFQTITRQMKSPFTLFHGKETQNLSYKVDYKSVDPNQPHIRFSRTQSNGFIDKVMRSTLKEFSVDKKEDIVMTHRDLQSSRKRFHNLDWTRQPKRVLGQQPDKDINDEEIRFNNFEPESMKKRSNSVHSFSSYTKRRDLYAEDSYKSKDSCSASKIDLKNVRKRWSSNTLVPFDKLAKTVKLRTDRDVQPWIVKLSYNNVKPEGHHITSRFDQQSERKPNQVHSKYPFRICV